MLLGPWCPRPYCSDRCHLRHMGANHDDRTHHCGLRAHVPCGSVPDRRKGVALNWTDREEPNELGEHVKKLVGIALAAMLSGCAGTYVPPGPEDPAASITVRNLSSNYAASILTHKEPEMCGGMTFIRTGHGKSINQNEVPQSSEFTFPAFAERLFGIYIGSNRPDPSNANRLFGCDRVATFVPRTGARYLVDFSYEPPTCRISTREIRSDGTLVAVPVRYRKQMPTSISRPSSHCSDTLQGEQ